MNVTSYYWSYIDFYTLITYTSYVTYTYNFETCIQKQLPKVFLRKSQVSQEHLCWGLFFTKLQSFRTATLLKRDSNTVSFLWNLKFLRTPIWRNIWCERLLLCVDYFFCIDFCNSLQYIFMMHEAVFFGKSISQNKIFSFWELKISFTEMFHESLKSSWNLILKHNVKLTVD